LACPVLEEFQSQRKTMARTARVSKWLRAVIVLSIATAMRGSLRVNS
jgi:hypothetical protein